MNAASACRFHVRGRVQGVGFRPYVERLARRCRLAGWVRNDGAGVLIHIEGRQAAIEAFQAELPLGAPGSACIESIACEETSREGCERFGIRAGKAGREVVVRVPADRRVCDDCLREVALPADRRHGHPFITCTACGPRYSIIDRIPYERRYITMARFPLCGRCQREYVDSADRRFHAEPIACHKCGPALRYFETEPEGGQVAAETALVAAVGTLRAGKIVAIKGLGGFQLLISTECAGAINRLRERKRRPTKPLAVMVPSAAWAERHFFVSEAESRLLEGPENPIVLLERRPEAPRWCDTVAPGLRHVGLLLPTTPLHHLLLAELGTPVVATSGNESDEPIVIDELECPRLAGLADAFLVHDRPIRRRVDDSVARVIEDRPVLLRLARGYAPYPLPALERLRPAAPSILAVGGLQKGALALWTGHQAVLSPHIGDLDGPETRRAFNDVVRDLSSLYDCQPQIVVHDVHPDYFTTAWARRSGKQTLAVQHHHAHAVATMIEHNLLDREVLALTWDGSGYGPDGTIWGGEVLRARVASFERLASLAPLPLPGGDAAIRQPARVALALVEETIGAATIPAALLSRLGFTTATARSLLQMTGRRVNTPLTSSVGRLFDGVACLLLGINSVSYEGEAAVCLEAIADAQAQDAYPLPLQVDAAGLPRGDWRPLVCRLLQDIKEGAPASVCAARFHNALARWTAAVIAGHPERDVVLGGGCFQNALLTQRVSRAIECLGKKVHRPGLIPPGDGGLAAGQLGVALGSLA